MSIKQVFDVKFSFAFLLFSLLILSCSKDNDDPVQPNSANLSGTWGGTIVSNLVSTPSPITLQLTLVNNNFTGTYSVITGAYGSISGKLDGNTVNFLLTQTTLNCPGTFSGQGTLNGNTLTFNYTGTDCWGSHIGTGSLTKYEPANDVISPLYVGLTWTYVDSIFTTTGAFSRADSSKLGITAKGNYNYQGQDIELFHCTWINLLTNKPDQISWLKRNEVDGQYTYGGYFRNQATILVKSLGQKFPVNVGESWNTPNISFYSTPDSLFKISDTSRTSCLSVNQNFVTPAGVFNCYVYTFQREYTSAGQLKTDDVYLYYAKNKGYVGYVRKTNGIQITKKVLKR